MKNFLKRTPFYSLLCWHRGRQQIRSWEESGRPLPPPDALKQRNIRRVAKAHGLRVLVETGTNLGLMVEAMRRHVAQIYTIELNKDFYDAAKKKFSAFGNIELIQGDSGVVLKSLVGKLDQPALFWLDGHYSGGATSRGPKDTPIIEELSSIYPAAFNHVAMIDDARLFGVDPAYPTIAEVREFVLSRNGNLEIDVADDAIRIMPKR